MVCGTPKSVPSVVCGADAHDVASTFPLYRPVTVERVTPNKSASSAVLYSPPF